MTHDELLADLDGFIYESIMTNRPDLRFLNALRAVVELHKPHEVCSEGCKVVGWCNECMEPPYPCPTIQAIEEQIK